MKKEMKAVPTFRKGRKIYVLDRGECKYMARLGWDERYNAELYEVERHDGSLISVPAYNCFELKSYSRTWTMGTSAIKVTCGVAFNFRTIVTNVGTRTEIIYEQDEKTEVSEIYEVGDPLPVAWRGYGIEFSWLIDRWLRRLEGEVISQDDEWCT